jgi:hypothetical protein
MERYGCARQWPGRSGLVRFFGLFNVSAWASKVIRVLATDAAVLLNGLYSGAPVGVLFGDKSCLVQTDISIKVIL